MTTSKQPERVLVEMFRREAQACLRQYLPRIAGCLRRLSDEEIWWRPNAASNAPGNLVLHLCGNVRQWIISGLGGAPDVRVRDREFDERGPVPRRELIARLQKTAEEACRIIGEAPVEALAREYAIQGYRVSGLAAVAHVAEHFAYHAGQILYATKLQRGRDLRFTRLPAVASKRGARKRRRA